MFYGWVGAVLAIIVGIAGMRQAVKNARTTDDRETGLWFIVSISIFLGGWLGILVLLNLGA